MYIFGFVTREKERILHALTRPIGINHKLITFVPLEDVLFSYISQPIKIDLNKKLLPKQKTIEIYIIDAQGFRKTKNENPPTREIGVASQPVPADLPMVGTG